MGCMTSIVIPAHNEGAVIDRTLTALEAGDDGPIEIVVVCNGCTDDTGDRAERFGVLVLRSPVPSKAEALRLGDTAVHSFPRFYLDADVELSRADLDTLVRALDTPGVLAVAPRRVVPLDAASPLVRSFYRVWSELPAVRSGLFGRGVVGLSQEGHARVAALPPAMSDDLAISLAFDDDERRVVTAAAVVIRPSRTVGDLVRRRVRSVTGNGELYGSDAPAARDERTSIRTLLALVVRTPRRAPDVAVFLAVAVLARLRAQQLRRRGAAGIWLRDESSRSPA
jgi:hypothetical protein